MYYFGKAYVQRNMNVNRTDQKNILAREISDFQYVV